jgi:hypothetical protein
MQVQREGKGSVSIEPDETDAIEEALLDCKLKCGGKIHHKTKESAQEHVAGLVIDGHPSANAYLCGHTGPCDDPEDVGWIDEHWHVASSVISRRDRKWVAE